MKKKKTSPKKKWITTEFSFLVIHACRPETRLLRFDNGRKKCQERLRQAVIKSKASVLNYLITPEYLRVIMAGDSAKVSEFMRFAASTIASDHAQRTSREGPFWKGRYNALLIQNGIHLLRVSLLIDRIMIDGEVCIYPGEWEFSGHREITGIRKRYRIVDTKKTAELTGFENEDSLRQWYLDDSEAQRFVEGADRDLLDKALAVGDRQALEKIGECFARRKSGNIEVIVPDDKNPTYGLFVPNKTKNTFTRSLKENR